MTWLAWRQFRMQAATAAAGLCGLAVLLLLTGPDLADSYREGLAACGSDCQDFRDRFVDDHQGMLLVTTSIVLMVPGLVGLFWGAPLVARELDAGTHRLVWNQSVTRSRWLATKLTLVGLGTALVAALAVWGVDRWSEPIDAASVDDPRLPWALTFAARGVVPVAYALFAFVLGVTVGMLARRPLPAMAITLALFVAVQAVIPLVVRTHLAPVVTRVDVVTTETLAGVQIASPTSVSLDVKSPDPGGWLLSTRTLDSSGRAVDTVPVHPSTTPECEQIQGIESCLAEIARLGYRQESRLHTSAQFWRLQAAEAALYAGLSAGLVGFCFWWLRRRLA